MQILNANCKPMQLASIMHISMNMLNVVVVVVMGAGIGNAGWRMHAGSGKGDVKMEKAKRQMKAAAAKKMSTKKTAAAAMEAL